LLSYALKEQRAPALCRPEPNKQTHVRHTGAPRGLKQSAGEQQRMARN